MYHDEPVAPLNCISLGSSQDLAKQNKKYQIKLFEKIYLWSRRMEKFSCAAFCNDWNFIAVHSLKEFHLSILKNCLRYGFSNLLDGHIRMS